ncbi:hypothetical protein BST61_czeina4g001370 [Lecanosticta acicola]|uniref:Nudix hydrolase domain-containing protein n=1 Tax=Lecanosticta acicola TaxID=111012 RepID=A0AAI8YSH3_9PEZI|nr:hypothetical protein BST61_czeina4g001370 [Lecanosticta acicola]
MPLSESWPKGQAFETHLDVSSFAVSPQAYHAANPDSRYSYIATGAIVFDRSGTAARRVLLLQRSNYDSMPGRWEIPGGGCDEDDETILHAAARELQEETGLKAARIGSQVGEGHFFTSRSGKRICKFTFVVEIGESAEGHSAVELDPKEHQNYVWATEAEVKAHAVGSVNLDFTTIDQEQVVLASFAHSDR